MSTGTELSPDVGAQNSLGWRYVLQLRLPARLRLRLARAQTVSDIAPACLKTQQRILLRSGVQVGVCAATEYIVLLKGGRHADS